MSGLDEESLGKHLQAARQTAGLTQQALCHKTGLSYSTLAKIERGAIKSPSIFTVQTIAAALGTSLDAIIGNKADSPALPKKISKSGVRFVYFDVNGCMVHFFQAAFTKLAHVSGQQPDVVESMFWHYNDAVCRGDMSLQELNALFAKRFGLPTLDWEKYYLEAVEPIAEMHELAAWACANYHVGLLTNIMPGFLAALKSRGLVPDLPYDAVIDSSKVGAIKPEKKIYEIATKRTGLKPEEILLIDDSRANLMAAEHYGWRVLWFDDYHPQEAAERVKKALEPTE